MVDLLLEKDEFRKDLGAVIVKHYGKFPVGRTYSFARDAFDREMAKASLNTMNKIVEASRHLGVTYRTFRKMLTS